MNGLFVYAEQKKRELLAIVEQQNQDWAHVEEDPHPAMRIEPDRTWEARRLLFVCFGVIFRLNMSGWVRVS